MPALIVLFAVLLSTAPVTAADHRIDVAIDRGLKWIQAHPATDRDGGVLDLVDEALFHFTVGALVKPSDPYRSAFDASARRLEESAGFRDLLRKRGKTLIEYYHLLLATRLIEAAGRETALFRERLVAEASTALSLAQAEPPTFRMTVGLLLQRLGAPPSDLPVLLDASIVNRVSQAAGLPPVTPLLCYALAHEIAISTDFGHVSPSAWLQSRRDPAGRLLDLCAGRAIESRRPDLLAEILLCRRMLVLGSTGIVRRGLALLLHSQDSLGTWGARPTPRDNPVRHAVQTATAALLAYRADGEDTGRPAPPNRPDGSPAGPRFFDVLRTDRLRWFPSIDAPFSLGRRLSRAENPWDKSNKSGRERRMGPDYINSRTSCP